MTANTASMIVATSEPSHAKVALGWIQPRWTAIDATSKVRKPRRPAVVVNAYASAYCAVASNVMVVRSRRRSGRSQRRRADDARTVVADRGDLDVERPPVAPRKRKKRCLAPADVRL